MSIHKEIIFKRKLEYTYIERTPNIDPCFHALKSQFFVSLALAIQIMSQIPVRPCTKCCIQSAWRVEILWCCKNQVTFHNDLSQPAQKLVVNVIKRFLMVYERLYDSGRTDAIFTEFWKRNGPHKMMEHRFDETVFGVQQQRRKFCQLKKRK